MIKKLSSKKGFTLMEMLIVVAIIAILIAIAIPTFTSSLNKAKVATDEANIRSGYAAVASTVLTDNITADTTYYLNSDGTVSKTSPGTYACQGKPSAAVTIGSTSVAAWDVGATVSYAYTAATGVITIITTAKA